VAERPRPGRTISRLLLLTVILLVGFSALPGCEDGYDVYILYPLRHDWIVAAESLEGTPSQIDPPGIMPLQMLDGRSGLEALGDDLRKAEKQGKIVDPRDVLQDDSTANKLMIAMRDLGGRPRYPKLDTGDDATNARLEKELKLDRKTLAAGSLIYRRNCLHCHGMNGDGRGPTGPWINPHPRDFRQGAFKFTSSSQGEGERKPRRDDLHRILDNGIEGSAMPSFRLMSSEDKEAVLSYVTHLSIRGEVEMETLKELILEKKQPTDEKPEMYERTRKWAKLIGERWLAAAAAEIKPINVPAYFAQPNAPQMETARLEAAARGYKFFIRPDQCVKCHTNFGRDSDYRYDAWGTIVKPRNYGLNQFAGGHRPIDFYYRIHSGIKGSGMPAMIANPGELAAKESTIWDLVSFIQILPYPEERAKLRRPPYNIFID
jgi:mono/diheme cytochrome c family protein